ncbi:hypothetical protein BXZ70DRAFT_961562 [Cristinia sonorae]|uniref:BTB domain-containing protein n=1 Tax=Cristinia sonorae TaxID=1940300 RepID=A0A8K0UEJ4_9AGAR|nr:hypothetical protein BXZ70DRAFT_961562 [Cristinia sonorae]
MMFPRWHAAKTNSNRCDLSAFPDMMATNNIPPTTLQLAIAESLHHANFTDTAYYLFSTRLSSGRVGKLKPVYANSTILKAAGQHFRGQLSAGFSSHHILPEETDSYDYSADSDLEDDDVDDGQIMSLGSSEGKGQLAGDVTDINSLTSPTPQSSVMEENSKFKHCLVIPDVALKTWRALIFYISTGRVEFAPLRSEGLEKRQEFLSRHSTEHPLLPCPCSPKSMYRLADIVGLNELKAKAFDNLQSRLDSSKILNEVFSEFTSRYPDVVKAEVDHFCDSHMTATSLVRLEEKITIVVRGELPHAQPVIMDFMRRLLQKRPSSPPPCGRDPPTARPSVKVEPSSPSVNTTGWGATSAFGSTGGSFGGPARRTGR